MAVFSGNDVDLGSKKSRVEKVFMNINQLVR